MLRWFENLIDPFGTYDEAAVPPRRLIPFIMTYVRPFRLVMLVAVVAVGAVAAIELALIWYTGRIVDVMAQADPSTVLDDHGFELSLAAGFILIGWPIIQGLDRALLNQTIIPNLGTMIRWRAHRHVLRQSVGWFEDDFAGRIANRMMQTPPAIGAVVYQMFDAVTYSLIYFIGSVALVTTMDVQLTLPLVIWLALYLGLIAVIVPRVGRASKASSDARSAITGRIVDAYTNIQSVKLFAHGRREEAYAREAIDNARTMFLREMRLYTVMDLGLTLINGFLIVSVIGYAIFLWTEGHTTIGTVAAASGLVLRLNAMTGWIMWALSNLFQELGVVAEGMETIAQPIDLTDAEGAKPLHVTDGRIAFSEVTHHYGKAGGGLNHISLALKGGERVGLVGASGAGKSTLVNLLLRFYEAEGGTISIDDQAITDVTQGSLRASIGMVTQDSSLLHRSVRDNLLYGRPDATDDQIFQAASRAQAHDFILGLSDPEGRTGYDAHVGERGVKLSGGQRQRIALARVILKNAPILILDEATSALDSEVEAAIQDTLYGVMEGKTVIAMAHRLSTIAHMDRIVVLDGGKIAEEGTHDALLARNGLYARFWTRQSGGFLGTDDSDEEAAE